MLLCWFLHLTIERTSDYASNFIQVASRRINCPEHGVVRENILWALVTAEHLRKWRSPYGRT